MEDGYCVKWEKHHNAVVSVFDSLYKHNVLVDCTLAAENKFIKAHRIVLMACSPYFEDLLSQHSDNYPIVWMNMKFSELQALIDFCYRGEVKLPQAELPGFLNAARLLHIKGLCETSETYRKRRIMSDESNTKKKYRLGSPIVRQVGPMDAADTDSDVATEVDAFSKGDTTHNNMHRAMEANGGDEYFDVVRGDSDNSDVDTDDESSGGEEKEGVVLEDIIRGGVTQYLYRWTCNRCGEALPTRAMYTEHRRICIQDSSQLNHPWACHKCPNTYKNKKDLVRHLIYCGVDTERHICERCGNTYKYERGLKRHKIYCGTDVKPMVCPKCGKTYKYKRGLRRHQRQQCGFESVLRSSTPRPRFIEELKSPTIRVKEEPASSPAFAETSLSVKEVATPSICKLCGKVYKYRKSFLNHVVTCVSVRETDDDDDADIENSKENEDAKSRTVEDSSEYVKHEEKEEKSKDSADSADNENTEESSAKDLMAEEEMKSEENKLNIDTNKDSKEAENKDCDKSQADNNSLE